MSATTARARSSFDRKPVPEQRAQRAADAHAFEVARKPIAKRVVSKIVGFFKKTVPFFKKVVAVVSRAPQAVVRLAKAHWPHALAGSLFVAAVTIAPGTTLTAASFIVAGYALARSESPFARFVAHVFFRTGVEVFAQGVVLAIDNRR